MPSKLLISAADAAWHARHAGVFGVETQVQVDGPAVMRRVQAERDRFAGFVVKAIDELRQDGVLVSARARFTGPNRLALRHVDGSESLLDARAFVIATGSRPFVPPPWRVLSEPTLLTTDQLFELPDLPKSLLVVGAGVIGLELGQAMHRLGVRTTILSIGGQIAFIKSRQVNAEAARILKSELDLHLEHELLSVEEGEEGVRVRFKGEDGIPREEVFEKVLMGAGRSPNWEGLDLQQAGVPLDERGRPDVNPYTNQVGDTHIFVAGDVSGHRPILHEAADEGRMAGTNAATWPRVAAEPRKTPLSIMFTDPQVASVGTSWPEMNCAESRVGTVDYGDQGRARVMNEHRGMVRIAGQAGTGLLLGAQMVGPRVEHTAHLLAWAVQSRMTVGEALQMPFYHPVVEEGIRTALRDLQGKLHLAHAPGVPCEEFGVGG